MDYRPRYTGSWIARQHPEDAREQGQALRQALNERAAPAGPAVLADPPLLQARARRAARSGVIVLAWGFGWATKDADAVVRSDPSFLPRAGRQVAEEQGWPEDWLNDGVKGFVSGIETLR
jgi:hypothetical protein